MRALTYFSSDPSPTPREVQAYLAERRVRGEWFDLGPDPAGALESLMARLE